MAWKKQNEKISFLYASGLLQSLRNLVSMASYVYCRLDLRPDGGSIVILTEFCRIDTGNLGDVDDVSHSLKS